jgi:head-tail adaptor
VLGSANQTYPAGNEPPRLKSSVTVPPLPLRAETREDIAETWIDLARVHATSAALRGADYMSAAGEYEQARRLLAGLAQKARRSAQ